MLVSWLNQSASWRIIPYTHSHVQRPILYANMLFLLKGGFTQATPVKSTFIINIILQVVLIELTDIQPKLSFIIFAALHVH